MKFRALLRDGALSVAAAGILLLAATGTAEASVTTASTARTGTVVSSVPAQTGMVASSAIQNEDAVGIDGVPGCLAELEAFGYPRTVARALICGIAALGQPDVTRAVAACTTGLVGTGVTPFVSFTACLAGANPA